MQQTLPVKDNQCLKTLRTVLHGQMSKIKMSDFWFSVLRVRSGLYLIDLNPWWELLMHLTTQQHAAVQSSADQCSCSRGTCTMQMDNLSRAFPEVTPALQRLPAHEWRGQTVLDIRGCRGWIMQPYAQTVSCRADVARAWWRWWSGLRSDWMLSGDGSQNGKIHHCWQGESKHLSGVTPLISHQVERQE